LKDSNDNFIESKEITKNSVDLKEKEKEVIKGVNLGLKQALEYIKNSTCFMIINTIPVTLAERFPANSTFDNEVSAMVITREVS
jgi:hypothetical protein